MSEQHRTGHGRKAGMPVSHATAECPRWGSANSGRSRQGRAWWRSWIAPLAGSCRGVRTVLPGLLTLMLVVGWSSGVQAQTITPTEIYEGETLTFTVTISNAQGVDYNSGITANFVGHHSTVATQQITSNGAGDWYFANADGSFLVRYLDTSHIPAVQDGDGYTVTFHLHAKTDSDTGEGDENLAVHFNPYNSSSSTYTVTLKDGARPTTSTPGVTVSETTRALTELGSSSTIEKTYDVVLVTDPGADVTVTVTVTNGDATAVSVDTATLTFTAGGGGNWNEEQMVTVRALNDADAVGETVTITHTASPCPNPPCRWRRTTGPIPTRLC